MAGDFNVKSTEWGSTTDDPHGDIRNSLIASLNMEVCNRRKNPTCKQVYRAYGGGISESIINVTFARTKYAHYSKVWEVLEKSSLSDHLYVVCSTVDEFEYQKEGRLEKDGQSAN